MSFLSPRRPKTGGPAPPASALRAAVPAALAGLRAAARANLVALLAQEPPVALDRAVLAGLLPAGGRPARPGPGQGQGAAARVLADPAGLPALFDPDAGFGAEVLLPLLLAQAFADGALRHDLAEICRRFLCERVLFHPGPPPQPLFTPGGVALLVASQTPHGRDLGAGFAALRAAAAELRGPDRPPGPWDQWLLRRMADAPGWLVPEPLAALPWVQWRDGDDGDPAAPDDPSLPGCWRSVLDLTP